MGLQKTTSKIKDLNPTISITTLSVNELNNPMKRKITRMNKEQDPTTCSLHKMHFKDPAKLKVKRGEKTGQTNLRKLVLISPYKINFKSRKMIRVEVIFLNDK